MAAERAQHRLPIRGPHRFLFYVSNSTRGVWRGREWGAALGLVGILAAAGWIASSHALIGFRVGTLVLLTLVCAGAYRAWSEEARSVDELIEAVDGQQPPQRESHRRREIKDLLTEVAQMPAEMASADATELEVDSWAIKVGEFIADGLGEAEHDRFLADTGTHVHRPTGDAGRETSRFLDIHAYRLAELASRLDRIGWINPDVDVQFWAQSLLGPRTAA
jgi:hypothetical protein